MVAAIVSKGRPNGKQTNLIVINADDQNTVDIDSSN